MIKEIDAVYAMVQFLLDREDRLWRLDQSKWMKQDEHFGYTKALRSVMEYIEDLQKQKENLE